MGLHSLLVLGASLLLKSRDCEVAGLAASCSAWKTAQLFHHFTIIHLSWVSVRDLILSPPLRPDLARLFGHGLNLVRLNSKTH